MNYKKIHDNLIERARDREYISGVHHRHHILPICEGGDVKGETIPLTFKEHYLVHLLRFKITGNYGNLKAYRVSKHYKKDWFRIEGNKYSKEANESRSRAMKDVPKSTEHRKNMSLGRQGMSFDEIHRQNLSKAKYGNNNRSVPMIVEGKYFSSKKEVLAHYNIPVSKFNLMEKQGKVERLK